MQILAVIGNRQMASRLIKATNRVTKKLYKLALGASTKSFGNIGHNRCGRIVDLSDQPSVATKGILLSSLKDVFRPSSRTLPDKQVGKRLYPAHDMSPSDTWIVPKDNIASTPDRKQYSVFPVQNEMA
jgi:hypothetical protein